ncbi:hypothetical protein BG004_000207 [Podila humilis]|nr:hypothetical protein BG004_000207 [Podila humilis]
MTRMVGAILLLRKLQTSLHETYGAFYQLMAKTQFMSLSLIAIGFCSRLSLISKAWSHELGDAYTLLNTWMSTFPKETIAVGDIDYEKQLPPSISAFMVEDMPDLPVELPAEVVAKVEDKAAVEGIDLGEVIARAELPATTLSFGSLDSPQTSKTTRADTSSHAIEDESHNLLGVVTPSSKAETPKSTKRKKKHDDFDLDSLFDGGKNKKSKVKKSSKAGSASVSERSNSASATAASDNTNTKEDGIKSLRKSSPVITPSSDTHDIKQTTTTAAAAAIVVSETKSRASGSGGGGAISNFDDIFNFGGEAKEQQDSTSISNKLSTPQAKAESRKQIDDIFGGIAKKKKKKDVSEIDSIFGSPKKKKQKNK